MSIKKAKQFILKKNAAHVKQNVKDTHAGTLKGQ